MKIAILNADLTLREIRDYAEIPAGKAGRILPVVIDADPAYDAATQKVIDGTPVVEVAQVRIPRVAVALTTAELAAIASTAERSVLLGVIQDLRNGTGTTAQRFQRTEKVCAWILAQEALGLR